MAYQGAMTTDNIPSSLLYTEFMDSVERHNEADRNLKALLCTETRKSTVTIRQRSEQFVKSGSDTTIPDMQHVDRINISLAAPTRRLLRGAITAEAWERGMDSAEVREHHAEALDADTRLISEVIMSAMLTDGGWYDAAMAAAPPTYKMNSFATTHDHYLAYNVAGVPTRAHFTAAKHHILEHGYERDFIAFINSEQGEDIENKAEWNTTANYVPTPLISRLQEFGLTPGFLAAGIPVYVEDWVPVNYGVVLSMQERPLHWRLTEQPDADGFMVYTEEPSAQYKFDEQYVRWTSATVTRRGAGVSLYFNSATYASPTFTI